MACALETVDIDKNIVHVFRFANSNRSVSLTNEQIDRIPYLASLVSNSQKFSCEKNEQGEFILNSSFRYTYFMIILAAVTRLRPSFLFSRLPRRANLPYLLELYDYLCIDSLAVPDLAIKIDPFDTRFRRQYDEATSADARDTAVEFLIAIATGKYDMGNLKTAEIIFNHIIDILSSPSVFGQRLRYQTLFVIEAYCSNIFSSVQHSTLGMYKRSLERFDDTQIDVDIIDEALEGPLTNMFHWRRKVPMEIYEDATISSHEFKMHYEKFSLSSSLLSSTITPHISRYFEYIFDFYPDLWLTETWSTKLKQWADNDKEEYSPERLDIIRHMYYCFHYASREVNFRDVLYLLTSWSKIENVRRSRETKFKYSGSLYFLRNQPKIEKCKSKFNRKVQKYRP